MARKAKTKVSDDEADTKSKKTVKAKATKNVDIDKNKTQTDEKPKKRKSRATKKDEKESVVEEKPQKRKRKATRAKEVTSDENSGNEEIEEKPKKRKSRAKKTAKVTTEEIKTVKEDETISKDVKVTKRKARASKAKIEDVEPQKTQSKEPSKTQTKKRLISKTLPPVINIGTAGHVDEGKSTLIQLLTGKFPDEHSEELRRGITIRLGYADCDINKCPNCPDPECWTIYDHCENCGAAAEPVRKVSFVDAPGHEILMQVMLSGAALMDGVMLVISANHKVPQPQTREHLAALTALGVKKIVIVQNKIDLVSEEEARKNYKDIQKFIKGTIAEGAPIIPLSAMHGANLDILLSAIQYFLPTPDRKPDAPMQMAVARSFDINRPGTKISQIRGGVLGGSLIQGKVKVGDEVAIVPGLKKRRQDKQLDYIPVRTKVKSISIGSLGSVDEARPGGLLAIQTTIDPSMTRSDSLSGSLVSSIDSVPAVVEVFSIKVNLFDKVVGSEEDIEVKPILKNEPILLTVGTATSVGIAQKIKGQIVDFNLKTRLAIEPHFKVALSRQFNKRWRLIGWGEIDNFTAIPTTFE